MMLIIILEVVSESMVKTDLDECQVWSLYQKFFQQGFQISVSRKEDQRYKRGKKGVLMVGNASAGGSVLMWLKGLTLEEKIVRK